MAIVTYTVQCPGKTPAILNAYRQLASDTQFRRLTGLYAFASYKGAKLLVECLKNASSSWTNASKRWIISIDGGITEPGALRHLLSIPKSELRVPNAEELLTRRLIPIHRFHPKSLLLETQGAGFEPAGILVGSANMTCNGLCFGHEHAVTVRLETSAGEHSADNFSVGLDSLETMISSATPIDTDFVTRYEAIRPKRPRLEQEFEDERSDLILQEPADLPGFEAAALAAATHLWVDVVKEVRNRGVNEEGNQIDLRRGTRVFFGFSDKSLPKNSHIGSVRVLYDTHSAKRNLRFGDNSMDKFDLPIPGKEGPPSYRNQTLLFTKESNNAFRLHVGTVGEIAAWKDASKAADTLFKMKGGREFGVF